MNKTTGIITDETIISVTIDWSKIPSEENNHGALIFESDDATYEVAVKAFKPKLPSEALKNRYVEKNGYLAIALENFHRKVETKDAQFIPYNNLGLTGTAIGLASNHAKTVGHWVRSDKYAHMEYDIYTFNSGRFDIYTYMLPTYPINSFQLHRVAVSVDDESPKTIYVGAPIDSESWRNNVRRNSSIHKSSHYIQTPGKHTIKVFFADAGVIFDKMVVDFGGLKNSYIGPRKETKVK